MNLKSGFGKDVDEFIRGQIERDERFIGYVNHESYVRGLVYPSSYYTFANDGTKMRRRDQKRFYEEIEVRFKIETWEREVVKGYAIVPLHDSYDGFNRDCMPTRPYFLPSSPYKVEYVFIQGAPKWIEPETRLDD